MKDCRLPGAGSSVLRRFRKRQDLSDRQLQNGIPLQDLQQFFSLFLRRTREGEGRDIRNRYACQFHRLFYKWDKGISYCVYIHQAVQGLRAAGCFFPVLFIGGFCQLMAEGRRKV